MKKKLITVSDLKHTLSLCYPVIIRDDETLEILDTVSNLYCVPQYDDCIVQLVTIVPDHEDLSTCFEVWIIV